MKAGVGLGLHVWRGSNKALAVMPWCPELLAPAVQHVGIHAVTQRQRSDGGSGLHARGHQLGLELRGVGAMRTAPA